MKATMGASRVRPVVLELVREHGPITHDELIGLYHRQIVLDQTTPKASESGIRTRLRELVQAGLVVRDTEEGRSTFGNRAKRWSIAPSVQIDLTDDDLEIALAFFGTDEEPR